jgi:hypothetical protein
MIDGVRATGGGEQGEQRDHRDPDHRWPPQSL